ncbi:unnamed protein product [Ectocarpus sp. 12 AP-2014]
MLCLTRSAKFIGCWHHTRKKSRERSVQVIWEGVNGRVFIAVHAVVIRAVTSHPYKAVAGGQALVRSFSERLSSAWLCFVRSRRYERGELLIENAREDKGVETRFFVRQEGQFIIQGKGDKRRPHLPDVCIPQSAYWRKQKTNTRPQRTIRLLAHVDTVCEVVGLSSSGYGQVFT